MRAHLTVTQDQEITENREIAYTEESESLNYDIEFRNCESRQASLFLDLDATTSRLSLDAEFRRLQDTSSRDSEYGKILNPNPVFQSADSDSEQAGYPGEQTLNPEYLSLDLEETESTCSFKSALSVLSQDDAPKSTLEDKRNEFAPELANHPEIDLETLINPDSPSSTSCTSFSDTSSDYSPSIFSPRISSRDTQWGYVLNSSPPKFDPDHVLCLALPLPAPVEHSHSCSKSGIFPKEFKEAAGVAIPPLRPLRRRFIPRPFTPHDLPAPTRKSKYSPCLKCKLLGLRCSFTSPSSSSSLSHRKTKVGSCVRCERNGEDFCIRGEAREWGGEYLAEDCYTAAKNVTEELVLTKAGELIEGVKSREKFALPEAPEPRRRGILRRWYGAEEEW